MPLTKTHFMMVLLATILSAQSLWASSKIWEGEIVKVQGTTVFYKAQYTPYASATLYPKHCDTPEKQGELLQISFAMSLSRGQVHVPCIDDIPATPKEFLAAAKPGMRIIGFMNRKQWHYVSLVVRDADVEVGYVVERENGKLKMRRPQANWPAQMSNAQTFSAKQFPDRTFNVELTKDFTAIRKNQKAAPDDVVQKGRPIMIIPEAAMRVEWIPTPAERWDPTKDPLKGNYGEYPKRSNPNIDETFYQGGTTGTLLEAKPVKREVQNHGPTGSTKTYDTWKIFVPYGPRQGEYIVPSRGHKTQHIVAGHFNSFPTFNYMKVGRRTAVWAYRNQRAPNFLVFDAQDMQAEGVIDSINGNTVTLAVPTPNGTEKVTITLDADATYHSLGQAIAKAKALTVGNTLRIYPARKTTVVAGAK